MRREGRRRRKLLNEEELKLLDAYDEAWAKVLGDSCLDSFAVGFRLGARFVFDAFINEDASFYDGEK